ncbi:MAG: AMP-binding protein, partial [Bdellovibrionales bacterium]
MTMTQDSIFAVPPEWEGEAWINQSHYIKMQERAATDPDGFWTEVAERLTWFERWNQVQNVSFEKPVHIEWYRGGKLNVCFNCVDRHLPQHKNKVAFHWEPEDPARPPLTITYQDLKDQVCRLVQGLKRLGVRKGDRVTLYMPMIPEAVYAMLACARLGAVHSVVFGGFSPDALADRIQDCESDYVITADEGVRGGKSIPLKANADEACRRTSRVKAMVIVRHTGAPMAMNSDRNHWYHDVTQ